ncbi:MAG: DUF523 domain-containing protein [Candidatus Eisenbacteria bacterium]
MVNLQVNKRGRAVLVSACLAGVRCRYDGGSCPDEEVMSLLSASRAIPVCPEQLGGLPTPREAAEIQGGDGAHVLRGTAKVIDKKGRDVTQNFVLGAQQVVELAKAAGVKTALLKSESPSCGLGRIVSGGRLVDGDGVLASLLKQNGISVISKP